MGHSIVFKRGPRVRVLPSVWLLLLFQALSLLSCSLREDLPGGGKKVDVNSLSHEMIVLGDRLEDPYSVDNMTKALESLYPTRAGRVDMTPTDVYVRFLPSGDEQFATLVASGLELLDHPVDYEIVREGDYYHDPSVPEDEVTWQYAVVPTDFVFPKGIRYEVLDDCFIPDNSPTRAGDGIDWEAVEAESYRLTGNGDRLSALTRAEKGNPSGRITIIDPAANGGKPFGVAGVQVCCNSFVKFGVAYTDRDGYYRIDKTFSSDMRYRIVFKNQTGFAIGLNLVLVPASVSTLGKESPEGVSAEITPDAERKLFRRCVVNNAAYEFYSRCVKEDLNIEAPPSNLRIWLLDRLSSSSAVMMHQGAFLESSLVSGFLGEYVPLVKVFAPDVTIGTRDVYEYGDLYALTVHELSHASHFRQVGIPYWNKYIQYIITSFVRTGSTAYGNGTGEGAGHCEVGEMWAYYMQARLYKDRYGGVMPSFGTSFWFYPQIFRYLDERGMTCGEFYKALTGDVTSRESLHGRLVELYPENKTMLDQVFSRFNE